MGGLCFRLGRHRIKAALQLRVWCISEGISGIWTSLKSCIFFTLILFLSPAEIEMLVDDPKDYEELHEMALDQELCIHITEDMLTMSPDQTNGYSGTEVQRTTRSVHVSAICSKAFVFWLLFRSDSKRHQLLHFQLLRDRCQDERTEYRVAASGNSRLISATCSNTTETRVKYDDKPPKCFEVIFSPVIRSSLI